MENKGAPAPVKSPTKHNIVSLVNKLIFYLGAIGFWSWFIALRGRKLTVPWLEYIGFLALLPVFRSMLQRCWWRGILSSFIVVPLYYFLIFPIEVIVVVAKLFPHIIRRPLGVINSTGTFIFLGIICLTFLGLVPRLSHPFALTITAFLNLFCVNLLFWCALCWASNPLKPLAELLSNLWRRGEKIVEEITAKSPQTAKTLSNWLKQHVVDEQGNLRNIDRLGAWVGIGFVCMLLILFLIFVSSYAIIYYAIHRAGWQLLSGLDNNPTLGTAWYYSLMISVGAIFNDVIPSSSIGRVIQSLQLFNLAVFLTFMICLFSYAVSTRITHDLESLKRYPKRLIEKLDQFASQNE